MTTLKSVLSIRQDQGGAIAHILVTNSEGQEETLDYGLVEGDTAPLHQDILAYAQTHSIPIQPALSLAAPTREALARHASEIAKARITTARTYHLTGTTALCDATAETISHLLALKIWGDANPTLTSNWVANDGSVKPLTGAQYVELANLVGPFALSTYNALGMLILAINSGAATSFAQIDALQWPE